LMVIATTAETPDSVLDELRAKPGIIEVTALHS
jgi:hypothetical protein